MTLEIRKTYKLYLGGEFVRSESGRTDPATGPKGQHLANISRGSRKDVRDAVQKARAAQSAWASKSGYLRGQILYRMAEMLEGRATAFADLIRSTSGGTPAAAKKEVRATIDRIVHYAGWTDKYQALLSSVNPVASSYFDFSLPEPTGVVGLTAPETPRPLGPRVARPPGHPHRQHLRRPALGEGPPARPRVVRSPRHERPPRRRDQPPERPQGRAAAAPGAPHGRQRPLPRGPAARPSTRRPARTPPSTSSAPPTSRSPTTTPTLFGPWTSIRLFTETKTTWHPVGW